MTGYRENSFDPYAYEQPGRPMRPFNWVQWFGVALFALAIAAYAYSVAATFGWMPKLGFQPMMAGLPLLLIGLSLINSRREPGNLVGSEQLAKNRQVLLITVLVCAAILGAALVIEFIGAN